MFNKYYITLFLTKDLLYHFSKYSNNIYCYLILTPNRIIQNAIVLRYSRSVCLSRSSFFSVCKMLSMFRLIISYSRTCFFSLP